MTTAVQRRRGTNTEHATFTGLDGEITVNTTTYTLHVHDGATVGGIVLAKADGSNIVTSSIDINGGTIDGTVIGGSTAAAGTFTSITGTSANINGTVTADGLTVDGAVDVNLGSDGSPIASLSGASAGRKLDIQSFAVGASVGAGYSINATSGQGELDFQTTGVSRLNIDFGGDISFYEDTGTTAKFFWDASAESLGIGTASPASKLQLSEGSATDVTFTQSNTVASTSLTQSANGSFYMYNYGAYNLIFGTSATERMRIDSSGNVGINATTIAANGLQIGNTSSTDTEQLYLYSNKATFSLEVDGANNAAGTVMTYSWANGGQGSLRFKNASGEVARLDASGNLLVGTTSETTWTTTAGFRTRPSGSTTITRSAAPVLYANRLTSDGAIQEFLKDGTAVGSIGSSPTTSQTYFAGTSRGVTFGSSTLYPCSNTGSGQDAQLDIGSGTYRFKNLYLSGGVYLGGTGAANHLDDYEEGTWTPTIVGTTSGSATVSSITSATYTKIGRTVHVAAFIGVDTSTHTVVGVVEVGGLPFNPSSDSGTGTSTYSTVFTDNTIINFRPLSGNKLRMMKGSSSTSYSNTDFTSATSRVLIFSAVYETTA